MCVCVREREGMISGASMGSFNPHFILSRCHLLSHERACNLRFPPNAIKMSSINATEACSEGCLKIYSRVFFLFFFSLGRLHNKP